MTELVVVEGEVVRVVPGGFEDHGEAGTVRRDQSIVRVRRPAELAGRTVRVVVDDSAAAGVLGSAGAVAFEVDPSDLDLDAVFSGALRNLRRPPEAER